MTTVQDAYTNALLADAAYVAGLADGLAGVALFEKPQERMTDVLAGYISTNVSVVSHIESVDVAGSGFDATVSRRPISGCLSTRCSPTICTIAAPL